MKDIIRTISGNLISFVMYVEHCIGAVGTLILKLAGGGDVLGDLLHAERRDMPSSLTYIPVSQLAQDTAPPNEKRPASHSSLVEEPRPCWYLPLLQGVRRDAQHQRTWTVKIYNTAPPTRVADIAWNTGDTLPLHGGHKKYNQKPQ